MGNTAGLAKRCQIAGKSGPQAAGRWQTSNFLRPERHLVQADTKARPHPSPSGRKTMMNTNNSARRGAILSLLAFSLYSLSDITIKFLGSSYHPAQIVFFASMAGFPLVVMQMMAVPDGITLRPVFWRWTLARMAIVIGNSLLVTYAFTNLPLSEAYAIFFLMPLFICVLAVPLLGESIDRARGLAVLAGLAGVIVVLRPGLVALTWPHLSALAGASLGALYYILLRKTGGRESVAVLMLYPMIAQTAFSALFLPFVYVPMPAAHLALAGLMAVEGVAGSLLMVWAYRAAPAVVVAPMQYVQIIIATLFGTLYFHEPMDMMTVVGISVIIAAGLFILTRPKPAEARFLA